MSRSFIRTFTGVEFDILEPTIEMICIEDIAHSLSMLCRFVGHTKYFYSVAQHSYLGSLRVEPELSLEFLLHDAAEAYIGDMSRPLKHYTTAGIAYQEVENRLVSAIKEKFHLPRESSPEIHLMDDAMLKAEQEQLMPLRDSSKIMSVFVPAAKVDITQMNPVQVESLYLNRFYTLVALRREEQWVS